LTSDPATPRRRLRGLDAEVEDFVLSLGVTLSDPAKDQEPD